MLKLIGPRLASGTVIVFDEYLGFPNWQDGEHLAWQTCVRDLGIRYQYLAFSPFQAAVQVL